MLFYHAAGTTDYANYPCKTKDKQQIFRYLKLSCSPCSLHMLTHAFQVSVLKSFDLRVKIVQKVTGIISEYHVNSYK